MRSMPSSNEITIRQRLKDDFEHYAAKCLKVKTKEGTVSPFMLNDAQRYIHAQLEAQLKDTGSVRALILKGRQQGCSTYVEGRFFWKVTHRKGVSAFILTHLDEATTNIFAMAERFYTHCPELVKPSVSASNAKELIFDKLDSGYKVGTAKSKGTGRSQTLHYFHGSEVAYWADPEGHVSGALQAVPNAPGTEVILESTSSGAQGLFHRMCMDASDGRGDYKLVFVPWFWQGEYVKALPAGFTLSAEEQIYKAKFGLSDQQIAWRRAKVVELNGEREFRREYPSTPEEAFEAEDMPFHRSRWKTVPTLPPGEYTWQIFYDVAYVDKKKSDHTAWIVTATDHTNQMFIVESGKKKFEGNALLAHVFKTWERYQQNRLIGAYFESTPMLWNTALPNEQKARNKYFPIRELKHQGRAKQDRIMVLDSALHTITLVGGIEKHPELVNEAATWTRECEVDDLMDDLAYAREEALPGRKPVEVKPIDNRPKNLIALEQAHLGQRPNQRKTINQPTRS
jgi:hypothetical protein